MRVRRRLHPFRLLPFRAVVIGVLVAACVAAARISPPHVGVRLAAHTPTLVRLADVVQPTHLRTLPVRRSGASVLVSAQLVAQLPMPAQHLTKPQAATVPVAGQPVRFSWRWHGRAHHRLVATGPLGWATLRLAHVSRPLAVTAGFGGAGHYAGAGATPISVPPAAASRSEHRTGLPHTSGPARAPRALRHYAAGAFVFPFLHRHEAEPPGAWTLDQGVDMFAYGEACGSSAVLVAVGNGVVIQEGISGFGPTAPVIRMTSGPLVGRNVYYGHTGRVFVPVGATVRAGQPIAEIGCGQVGYSAGPHLEIGVSVPGGPSCCPGFGQTSHEMYHLLAAAY